MGDKMALGHTLESITRVPKHILKDGLASYCLWIAQIISWVANRTTTPQVEDGAYSLMSSLRGTHILADPSFFYIKELFSNDIANHDKITEFFKQGVPAEHLSSIDPDHFGTFL